MILLLEYWLQKELVTQFPKCGGVDTGCKNYTSTLKENTLYQSFLFIRRLMLK
jgi:hypothetical protein